MATRVAPTPFDADNSAGSFTLAACSDWRSVRRFHVGTGHAVPHFQMPDIRLQARPYRQKIDQPLPSRGESIYAGLESLRGPTVQGAAQYTMRSQIININYYRVATVGEELVIETAMRNIGT